MMAATMLDRAVVAKQMLEQALRRSAQRVIQVTQTYRQAMLTESNGLNALGLRVDALGKKLGADCAPVRSAE